jgi:hypothetical protein
MVLGKLPYWKEIALALHTFDSKNFFLATESLSERVTVVPSGNTPTRVSPSLTLSPNKKFTAFESPSSSWREDILSCENSAEIG